MPVLSSECWY